MALSEFELGELYRDALISLAYMFAYEYGESVDELRETGRWDAWLQGTQDNYGPVINRVMDALIVEGTDMQERVETWYRENYPLALANTLGSLTRSAFSSDFV